MSQTFDVTSVVARKPANVEDHADQARVLIFCAVGLAISLIALLIAPIGCSSHRICCSYLERGVPADKKG